MDDNQATRLSPLRRAKRPRTVLAGPYGHPFHALLVTIPIGAWTASLVFDILGLVTGDTALFGPGAAWLIVIGLAGAVLAIVTGLLDYGTLTKKTRAHRMATTHLIVNLIVSALFVVGAVLRLALEETGILVIGISVLGLLLLGFSGFLGGELVYRLGVRVADEKDQEVGHEPHH